MQYGTLAAALVAMLASLPAGAQQLWAPLPHPTDSGKPVIFDPAFTAKAENDRRLGCAPECSADGSYLASYQTKGPSSCGPLL